MVEGSSQRCGPEITSTEREPQCKTVRICNLKCYMLLYLTVSACHTWYMYDRQPFIRSSLCEHVRWASQKNECRKHCIKSVCTYEAIYFFSHNCVINIRTQCICLQQPPESNVQCQPITRRNRYNSQTCSSIASGDDVMGQDGIDRPPISLIGNPNHCTECILVALSCGTDLSSCVLVSFRQFGSCFQCLIPTGRIEVFILLL